MEILLYVRKNIAEFETNNCNYEDNYYYCAFNYMKLLIRVENNTRYIRVLLFNNLSHSIKTLHLCAVIFFIFVSLMVISVLSHSTFLYLFIILIII